VDTTLRYVIEQSAAPRASIHRSAAGAGLSCAARAWVCIELLGIAAFRISPVWVFAALADLSGPSGA